MLGIRISQNTKTIVIIALIVVFFGGAILAAGGDIMGALGRFWAGFVRLLGGEIS
ncbi:MAG: hypothetical protein M1457_11830 [bacterium]|nr:hypothetical protein [bacterium]